MKGVRDLVDEFASVLNTIFEEAYGEGEDCRSTISGGCVPGGADLARGGCEGHNGGLRSPWDVIERVAVRFIGGCSGRACCRHSGHGELHGRSIGKTSHDR